MKNINKVFFLPLVFTLSVFCKQVLGQDASVHPKHDLSSEDGFTSYSDDIVNWFETFDESSELELSAQSSVVTAALSDCVSTNFDVFGPPTTLPPIKQKLLCLNAPIFIRNLPLMIVINHLANKEDTAKLRDVFGYTEFLITVVGDKHKQKIESHPEYGKHYISTLDGGAYHESRVAIEHRFDIDHGGFADYNISFVNQISTAYDQNRLDDIVLLTEQEISRITQSIR